MDTCRSEQWPCAAELEEHVRWVAGYPAAVGAVKGPTTRPSNTPTKNTHLHLGRLRHVVHALGHLLHKRSDCRIGEISKTHEKALRS